ncbi:MAG: D-TA family PLP-dependent enzyme [Gemmatales bacterium]|nr:D-TA family PLP-dependent enzyme [Gemmatales bacterium]MDW7994269.1 D-TA family PLP-dependent enzyme [Gemmatales bacterium]
MDRQLYAVQGVEKILSPALLFFRELIEKNLARMLEIAGSPERLCPHVKTHKCPEIVKLAWSRGIRQHKCATLAEAVMLAEAGASNVLIAYPIVGPNCLRLAEIVARFPQTKFAVIADHPLAVEALSSAMSQARLSVDVLVDLDVGQHRTGVPPGEAAVALYEKISHLPGLRPGGLHAYDGHNQQADLDERRRAVDSIVRELTKLLEQLHQRRLPVPRIVVGGTPTFTSWAAQHLPGLQCSPGTCVLHDANYARRFPDLGFVPAALVLTRVVSRPSADRLTLDLGYKAVCADPPAGQRCVFPDLPEARQVLHNEEHLVLETPLARRFQPGDTLMAIPAHVCPTCAMYDFAWVVEQGRISSRWPITARGRLT